jgi:tRNA-2-methylthio-N6-dimethylallyladenosine synthase
MFAFKYSHRPETSAAALEDHLDDDIKSKRLYEIIEIQNQITDIKNKTLRGSNQQILIETISDSGEGRLYQGRTRSNKIVYCTTAAGSCRGYRVGDLADVIITKPARHSLSGIIK